MSRSPNLGGRGHIRAMLRGKSIGKNDEGNESSSSSSSSAPPLTLRPSRNSEKDELLARIAELEEERSATNRLKLFMEQLSAILSSDVNRIVDAAYSFIPAEYINLFVVKDDHLKCVVSRNKKMKDKVIRRGDGIFGYVAKSGRAVNLVDPLNDWRYDAESDVHAGMGDIKSLLVVPIRGPTGSVTCVMEAVNCLRKPGTKTTPVPASPYRSAARSKDAKASRSSDGGDDNAFSFDSESVDARAPSPVAVGFIVEDEVIMHILAQGISLMAERDDLLTANMMQKKQTDALHQIVGLNSMGITTNWKDERGGPEDSKRGGVINSQKEAVKKIIRACYMICDIEFVSLYLVDHVNHELLSTGKASEGTRRPFRDSGIEGFVATSGQVVNCPDTSKDLRFDLDPEAEGNHRFKTMLVVPVKDAFGSTIAVIKLCNRKLSDSADVSRRFSQFSTNSQSKNDLTLPFSDVDEQMVCSLATTAAGILEQARLYEDAVNTRTATETLLRINELIQRATGVEMIIPKIIESAYRLIDAERITLFTMQEQAISRKRGLYEDEDDEKTKVLLCRVSADPGFVGVKLPWGKGIVGQAARTQKTIVIRDAYKDPRFNQNVDKKTSFITKSIITVPIIDWNFKCVGVIQAINRKNAQTFTADDVANLEHLATSAGIVLRKATLYESALNSKHKADALMHVLKIVTNQTSSMTAVIEEMLHVISAVTASEDVQLFFVSPHEKSYFTLAGDKHSTKFSVAGFVAEHGITVTIADAYDDPRFDPKEDANKEKKDRTRSLICVPVKDKDGEVMAVIQASNKRKHGGVRPVSESYRLENTSEGDDSSSSGHYRSRPVTPMSRDSMGMRSTNIENESERDALYTSFDQYDEDVMDAMCYQIRTTIRRFLHPAMRRTLTESQSADLSILELYSRSESFSPDDDDDGAERKRGSKKRKKSVLIFPAMDPTSDSAADLELLRSFRTFNVWEYSDDDLLSFTLLMFRDMNLLEQPCSIDLGVFKDFVVMVSKSYRNNPFHNWKHGFSALHFTYLSLRVMSKALNYLNPLDVLGVMVASLCHDVDHPGVTNSFEIASSSDLALTHNDIHVLENHHAHQMFLILREHNIFSSFSTEDRKELRSVMITAILATDLSGHFDDLKKLDAVEVPEENEDRPLFDVEDQTQRRFVVNAIIHNSDLSAQTFPTSVAARWEQAISLEFEAQAKQETALGLPVAPFMQNLADPYRRNHLQVNFIKFVLNPWWAAMSRVFPGFKESYTQLQENMSYYDSLAKRPEEQKE